MLNSSIKKQYISFINKIIINNNKEKTYRKAAIHWTLARYWELLWSFKIFTHLMLSLRGRCYYYLCFLHEEPGINYPCRISLLISGVAGRREKMLLSNFLIMPWSNMDQHFLILNIWGYIPFRILDFQESTTVYISYKTLITPQIHLGQYPLITCIIMSTMEGRHTLYWINKGNR